MVGSADINGDRQDISGAPQNFSGSAWAFGGAATVGATYFLDSFWFVDLNYKYAVTVNQKFNYASTYSTPTRRMARKTWAHWSATHPID